MYRGFQLNVAQTNEINRWMESGKKRYSLNRKGIEKIIDSFIQDDGKIDGTKMQSNWFPQVKTDIFLSHSHKDEELAIALSGFFYEYFGLETFIDSCIWGYSDKLLSIIDKRYCRLDEINRPNSYSYEQRNYSTSHVHMMLSTALSMMIDNTECVMFLNTPNSVTPEDTILKTESPWIYSEIAMTRLIRQKLLDNYRMQPIMESFSAGGKLEKSLKIEYNISLDHLENIDNHILARWNTLWKHKGQKYSDDYKKHSLDILYELIPLKKI